jgi:hypothetical protein
MKYPKSPAMVKVDEEERSLPRAGISPDEGEECQIAKSLRVREGTYRILTTIPLMELTVQTSLF